MPKFIGSGGAVFEITPPEPGTNARENFDAQLRAGQLVPVEEPAERKSKRPAPKPAAEGVDRP